MHALYITHTHHRRTPFHFLCVCAFDDASLSLSLFGNTTRVTVRPTAPTMTRLVMKMVAAERRATSTDARATDARRGVVRGVAWDDDRRVERRDATRETNQICEKSIK